MAAVPISLEKLTEIVGFVAEDLFVELVSTNDATDDLEWWAKVATDAALFVIDRYMEYINNALDTAAAPLA